MVILRTIKQASDFINTCKSKNKVIGFVPTMGALHEGHFSLVRKAFKECDIVITSIFINPAQFSKNEDLSKYPRDFNKDKKELEELKVNAIFVPNETAIYPKGYLTYVTVDGMSNILCGVTRPTHFRGVATVVTKLFNIIKPDFAYFGEKDFQQTVIIKKLVRDLNFDINIKTVSIVREKSMLALSSRNVYLSDREREDAPAIYKSLKIAKEEFVKGEVSSSILVNIIKNNISNYKTLKIDYVSIVDSDTLTPVETATKHSRILIACYCGATRLIDNISLK